MTDIDHYFHVIPEVSYAEPQVYKSEDSYAEPKRNSPLTPKIGDSWASVPSFCNDI